MVVTDLVRNTILNSPRISPPCLLGLDSNNTQANQPDRFLFVSPRFSQKLSILRTVICRNTFMVVMGESGSGKTTMMNRLMADDPEGWQSARIKLKLSGHKTGNRSRETKNRLVFLNNRGQWPSLMIDNAHQMHPLELQALISRISAKDALHKLQSIILFAKPSIRKRFNDIAKWLPPRTAIDKMNITPLTERETLDYLAHRFKMAGVLRTHPFNRTQLHTICELSGGLPGRINEHALAALREMSDDGHQFKVPLLKLRLPESFWKIKNWKRHPLFANH